MSVALPTATERPIAGESLQPVLAIWQFAAPAGNTNRDRPARNVVTIVTELSNVLQLKNIIFIRKRA